LIHLDVSVNHIECFPPEFPYLYRIQVLLAFSNDIQALPKDIGFKMKGLVRLDVADNMIESVPESLIKCPNLKQVNLNDNKIMTFPASFHILRDKVEVTYEEQTSFKEREPRDRVKSLPLDVSTASKTKKGRRIKKGVDGTESETSPVDGAMENEEYQENMHVDNESVSVQEEDGEALESGMTTTRTDSYTTEIHSEDHT